jgi:hypothetical protein
MATRTKRKNGAARASATPRSRAAPRRRASRPRAQAETAGTMDHVLSLAEQSGGALARRIEEHPLMMLAGAGVIGLIAAAMFASHR